MKKLKLEGWVKVVLFIVAFMVVFGGLLKIGSERADRIDRGCMTLIDHNAGDR